MILQEYSYSLSHFRIWDVDFLPTLLTYNVTKALIRSTLRTDIPSLTKAYANELCTRKGKQAFLYPSMCRLL